MTIHSNKIWGILFLVLGFMCMIPQNGYAQSQDAKLFEEAIQKEKNEGKIKDSSTVEKGVNLDAMYGESEWSWKGAGAWFVKNLSKAVANSIYWRTKVLTLGNEDAAQNAYYNTLKGLVWIDSKAQAIFTSATMEEVDAYLKEKVLIENEMYEDANGKKWVVVKNKDGEAVSANYATEGNWKGCEVLPVKLYRYRNCFFCPLFSVIYVAADKMATISISKLAGAFATIIALGLGLWIAVQTLVHVSSLTKQDAPKFLGNLIKQSFKFIIAFLLLNYADQIYTYVVSPLLFAGLTFGKELLFITDAAPITQGNSVVTELYDSDLYYALENFIAAVQQEIGFMQAIGSSLMCIGGHKMMGIGGFDFGNGFQMAIQGLLLAGFGLLLSLAFAFYLIDAVVQLGIVGALMPFLIACWPFKLTSGYTAKGFSMLLNSFFVFVFMGLVVSVNLQLVDAALQQTAAQSQKNNDAALSTEEAKEMSRRCSSKEVNSKGTPWVETEECKTYMNSRDMGGLQALYDAIHNQDSDTLKELTDISALGFIILLICCIFGFKFCAQASSLADKMAGGGMKGIGASIGTMGASAAVSTAKKVTQPTREALGDKIEAGTDKALGWIKSAPARAVNKFRGGKKNGAGGEDGEGENETPNSTPNPDNGAPDNNNPSGGSGKKTVSQSESRRPNKDKQNRNNNGDGAKGGRNENNNRYGGDGSPDAVKNEENPEVRETEVSGEKKVENNTENANANKQGNAEKQNGDRSRDEGNQGRGQNHGAKPINAENSEFHQTGAEQNNFKPTGGENNTANQSKEENNKATSAEAENTDGQTQQKRQQLSEQEKARRKQNYRSKLQNAQPRQTRTPGEEPRADNKSKGGSNRNNRRLVKKHKDSRGKK